MRPTASHPTEYGVLLPHARGAETATFARRAEACGFDRLVARGGPGADPLATLGFAAAATERVRLAPAGLPLPWHPARIVARAARTLDELSGGRVALWVTTRPDTPPHGLTTGAGRAFDAQLDELAGGPAAAVPLLLEATDRRALERAGRRGDGVVLGPAATPECVAGARTELEGLWRRHDRGGTPSIVAFVGAGDLVTLDERVGALAAAGATGVVVAPGPGEDVELLAAALDLRVRRG